MGVRRIGKHGEREETHRELAPEEVVFVRHAAKDHPDNEHELGESDLVLGVHLLFCLARWCHAFFVNVIGLGVVQWPEIGVVNHMRVSSHVIALRQPGRPL